MEEDLVSVLQHAKDAALWEALPGRSPTSQLPTLPELGKVFQAENYQGSFVDMLKEKLSTDIMNEIFCKTKKQHLCPLWKLQRVGALTSSTLHKAARYQGNDR